MKTYIQLLLVTLFVPVLSACDQEDDVIDIFTGKATSASVNGDWNANGNNRELKITVKNAGTDADKYLGKAFMDGLKNAFKYGGDNKNLYIYYKEGQTVKFISFAPQRNSGN